MHFQTTLALLGLAATALAKSSSDYPECIQACITKRPTSSFCTGSETGSALDFCTCQSLSGSLLIECMQACPESDRAAYAAAAIPESCQKTLFPGVQVDNSGSGSGSGSSDKASTTASSASAEETVAEEVTNETEVENTTAVVAPPATTLPPVVTTPVPSAGADTASESGSDAAAETSATSTDADNASQTSGGAAAASESGDDGSAAMGREIPGLLAVGALAAAILL